MGSEAIPCLNCGQPLPPARGGTCRSPCPNCRHPYPHGDCSDGYASGSINVSLEQGGCRFGLNYPGVNTGSGTCEIQ